MYEYVIDTIEMVSRGLQWQPAVEPGEVITRRAAQGWRFCQIFQIPGGDGLVSRPLQIIFERPVSAPRDRTRADEPRTQP
ncbi:MAG: DUF4177 domain-containing protein [Brooklawnia sp.]|jgi:hypothetical protein